MADAVIVVDMLRCFIEPGHPLYVGDKACEIIPNVQKLLEKELARGSRIFFICDNHAPDDPEFKMFPLHCIASPDEKAHRFALEHMEKVLGAKLTSVGG